MRQPISHRMTYQGRADTRVTDHAQKKLALDKRIQQAERNCTMLARKADAKSIDSFVAWSVKLYELRDQRKALK